MEGNKMAGTLNTELRKNYGAIEISPITPEIESIRDEAHRNGSVPWTDKGLAKIVRLRLISDPGYPFWDLSYCYGRMKDGRYVLVSVPFYQIPKNQVVSTILAEARRDGVYAKGLGLFNFDVISKLV
jgi:hypothetical protein